MLNEYLIVSGLLFAIGLMGIVLNNRNLIINLFGIELMLLSVNLNFVIFSHFLHDLMGQIFTLFVLTVAAAESAIGLAILIVYIRQKNTIAISSLSELKG